MKKLFLCTLLALLSNQLISAQNKGDMYVGGVIGVSTNSLSDEGMSTTVTNFSFAPEFGYFVADRLRLSGTLAYGLTSAENSTIHSLTIGPSLAYYVRLCDRFYYTPEFGLGFAFGSIDEINGCGFTTGLSFAAFEYKPSTHCGLSFSLVSLDYTYLSYSEYNSSSNHVDFRFGISPTIGFKYYF